MGKVKDMTGRRFGRLVARAKEYQRHGVWYWRCDCDCGASAVVNGAYLRKGAAKSCGCYRREYTRQAKTVHGQARSLTHNSWRGMVDRCRCPSSTSYPRYGGKGITVCDRWLEYANFLADMGERPSRRHSIDRIDGAKGYEPGNCRWATPPEQAANKKSAIWVEFEGEVLPFGEACRRKGLSRDTVRNRVYRGGISYQEAFDK